MEEKTSNNPYQKPKNISSLETIGNFIKEARLSRNESISDLANKLKISEYQLKAIEEGNEELLPEKVFIKAMVRRISEKLKLDTKFIMSQFNNEIKEVKIEDIVKEVSIKSKRNENIKDFSSFSFGLFIIISGILGLLASSFIFNIFIESIQNRNPTQEIIKNN